MKEKKILTISVAAYNLGNMIEKNLNSIVQAKHNNLVEVIVTNDGSTDDTQKIVEKYTKKYPNIIKLINKKNEGAGSTVNSGIKNATGKYFKMIDGDDWVDTNNLDKLLIYLKEIDCDMVLTDYEIFNSYRNSITDKVTYKEIIPNKIYDMEEFEGNINLQMHGIVYKTSILRDNNIRLDNGFYTDQEYVVFPLNYVKKFIYYNITIYIYLVGREGQSVSINSLKKHIDMHELVLNHLIEYYKKNKDNAASRLMRKRIATMAKTHFNVLLSCKMSKGQVSIIKDFCKYIKESDQKIYDIFMKGKKQKIVIKSNFHLLKLVSFLYRTKLKIRTK